MTHFNGLTEAESERLAILAEECAEVTHAVCKILRHGYGSYDPTSEVEQTNREALEIEIGDLLHVVRRIIGAGDVRAGIVEEKSRSKADRMRPYLHHQR